MPPGVLLVWIGDRPRALAIAIPPAGLMLGGRDFPGLVERYAQAMFTTLTPRRVN